MTTFANSPQPKVNNTTFIWRTEIISRNNSVLVPGGTLVALIIKPSWSSVYKEAYLGQERIIRRYLLIKEQSTIENHPLWIRYFDLYIEKLLADLIAIKEYCLFCYRPLWFCSVWLLFVWRNLRFLADSTRLPSTILKWKKWLCLRRRCSTRKPIQRLRRFFVSSKSARRLSPEGITWWKLSCKEWTDRKFATSKSLIRWCREFQILRHRPESCSSRLACLLPKVEHRPMCSSKSKQG